MAQISLSSETLRLLQQSGGYRPGTHVELTSGKHANIYFNKDLIIADPVVNAAIAKDISKVVSNGTEIVIGPVTGGLLLAQALALELSKRYSRHVLCLGIPKAGLKRGQKAIITKKRVVLIDDVIKTGHTLQQAVTVLKASGADLQQTIALCNWRGRTFKGLKIIEILQRPYLAASEECKLCKQGLVVEFGVK